MLSAILGSLPEIGGDAILYCDPYDINDMADKLGDIMTGKYVFSKKKYDEQLKKFSWESAAKKYIDLFKNLYEKSKT